MLINTHIQLFVCRKEYVSYFTEVKHIHALNSQEPTHSLLYLCPRWTYKCTLRTELICKWRYYCNLFSHHYIKINCQKFNLNTYQNQLWLQRNVPQSVVSTNPDSYTAQCGYQRKQCQSRKCLSFFPVELVHPAHL